MAQPVEGNYGVIPRIDALENITEQTTIYNNSCATGNILKMPVRIRINYATGDIHSGQVMILPYGKNAP